MSIDLERLENRLDVINAFDGQLQYGAERFNRETNRSGKGRPSSGFMTPEQAKAVEDTGRERHIRRTGMWRSVDNCPVCGGSEAEFFLERMGMRYRRCAACTHVYADPVIEPGELGRIYGDDQTGYRIYTQPLQKEIDRKKYRYGVDIMDTVGLPGRERILDIGCGAGVFLQVAHECGWPHCVGVDANSAYSETYREIEGVQFVNCTFESLDRETLGSPYDAVSMWSVLEHIYEPTTFLESLGRVLKPGGIFFVLVPNVKSLATRLTRTLSPCFNWKHVHCFSPESLRRLVEGAGFRMLHRETAITEIENIKSYMSGEFPYHGYGDPDGLFDFITPEYIHRNLLGSRLIAVFRYEG